MLTMLRRAVTPLIQIRRTYAAICFDLRLTVQGDGEGWDVQVRDREGREPLYTARRCSLEAAKAAAAEFAVFRMTGAIGSAPVAAMTEYLPWTEAS